MKRRGRAGLKAPERSNSGTSRRISRNKGRSKGSGITIEVIEIRKRRGRRTTTGIGRGSRSTNTKTREISKESEIRTKGTNKSPDRGTERKGKKIVSAPRIKIREKGQGLTATTAESTERILTIE